MLELFPYTTLSVPTHGQGVMVAYISQGKALMPLRICAGRLVCSRPGLEAQRQRILPEASSLGPDTNQSAPEA